MERPEITTQLTRGARRALASRDYASLQEFSPTPGLRVDLFGLSKRGEMVILEVKSGLEDLRADRKWPDYLCWCDKFYFCVDLAFPLEALPPEPGVMRADGFGAEVVRDAPEGKLAAARRRSLSLRFARDAARRLQRLEDPSGGHADAQ
ncbi:MAG: MmcB family DNA repair protein [Rhodobacteraceae bacterium]|nr:MmcB family DNA repair protein [Paracoccaceae bacterium]